LIQKTQPEDAITHTQVPVKNVTVFVARVQQSMPQSKSSARKVGDTSKPFDNIISYIIKARPKLSLIETSENASLELVQKALAEFDFTCVTCSLSASKCGSPDRRASTWMLAFDVPASVAEVLALEDSFWNTFNELSFTDIGISEFLLKPDIRALTSPAHIQQGRGSSVTSPTKQKEGQWKSMHMEIFTALSKEWPCITGHLIKSGFKEREAEIVSLCDSVWPVTKEGRSFLETKNPLEQMLGYPVKDFRLGHVYN